jgi:hypothetical protein
MSQIFRFIGANPTKLDQGQAKWLEHWDFVTEHEIPGGLIEKRVGKENAVNARVD